MVYLLFTSHGTIAYMKEIIANKNINKMVESDQAYPIFSKEKTMMKQ